MRPTNSKLWIATALFASGLAFSSASWSASPSSDQQIEQYELQQKRVTRELEFTKVKLVEAKRKLKNAEDDLVAQKEQVKRMQAQATSESAKELLKNEQQRLAVAELSIKSQTSAYERLQRREADLQAEIAAAQQAAEDIKQSARKAEAKAKRLAAAKARQSASEIERLSKENRQLKLTLLEEKRRLANAEQRIEELVRTSDQRLTQIKDLEEAITAFTAPPANAIETVQNDQPELDLSTVVLEGETPIYQGEDGEKIIMRSHSIDEKVTMKHVGANLYQVDVSVDPGRAYFDLKRRRYRGVFPKGYEGQYRFLYDLSNDEQPVLTVQQTPDTDTQVVSTPGSDF